jgi:PTH1 family peptidyl-tRNA hydrolase
VPIKLIVGLANPGAQYAKTRHNAGAWLVEKLAAELKVEFKVDKKFHGASAQINLSGEPCRLLIPTTYMNLSGKAVQALTHFYQIEPQEILVIHDELDLAPGIARLKFDGGHGGHNGLSDIFEKLGSQQFYRIRIGIGKPSTPQATSDFVLSTPSLEEQKHLENAIAKALDILPLLIKGKIEEAMKTLNTLSLQS